MTHRLPTRRWAHFLCLTALLWVALIGSARAAAIPFGDRDVRLTAREQPIHLFLQDLFGLLDLPVAVSPGVKGAVNGQFSGPAERVYRNIARSFGLVEYYDGAVVHIYSPSEMGTRTLPLPNGVAARVIKSANEMQLTDARNRVRSTSGGALIASGTRRFIEQVEELARAQHASSQAQPPLGFKVFYLRYAWAQDVSMSFGGRSVVVPGVASIVRALMTSNPKSRIHVAPQDQALRPTQPRLRGQGLARTGGGQTLGAPDADPRIESAEAVMAAYGGGAGGAATSAGGGYAPVAAPLLLGDTHTVRVEADTRLNAVIVRDAPERLPQYEQLVRALDVEPQPLEIEATIVDVNTDKLRELGINWRYSGRRGSALFGNGTQSDNLLRGTVPPDQITPIGRGGFISAVLGGANEFVARINALQDQGAARVVSSPQVVTLSNVEAVFDNSKTFYVRVAGRDEVDLFNVSAGTTLRVTPHVFRDRDQVRIKLLVHIDDGLISQERVDQIPVVERSSINTQALIFEGESLLIGGLVRESSSQGVTKVPFLGDIPIVGNLFKSRSDSNARFERMFMITPRLSPTRRAPLPAATGTPPPAQPPAAPPSPLSQATPAAAASPLRAYEIN